MLWLLACFSTNDTHLHQRAIQDGTEADCSTIQSSDLKGDCMSWKAGRLASEGHLDQAEAICITVEPPNWQGECWFLVADSSSAMREDAAALCAKAGPFETECSDHAIQRLAEHLMETPSNEMEALAEITEHWSRVYGPKSGEHRAKAMIAGLLELRPHPLTRASFGQANDELIQMALIQHLSRRSCSLEGLDVQSLAVELESAMPAAKTTRQCQGKGPPPGHSRTPASLKHQR